MCWFFHDYKDISFPIVCDYHSVIFKEEWKENHMAVWQVCKKCGKDSISVFDVYGDKIKINERYVKKLFINTLNGFDEADIKKMIIDGKLKRILKSP